MSDESDSTFPGARPRRTTPPFDPGGWQTPAFVRPDVVVADDDPHMRRLLLAALRQFGFLPIDAANPQEGLERDASAARIHLLVTDLILPEVSSTEIARRWRLKQPRLKAVCLRANASALFDAHLHNPLSLTGVCDALAVLHHADVTARADLRRRYSMAFGEVSEELRAQAWDLFTRLAPHGDAEMNSVNTVILVFAELPRDDPFGEEMRRHRGTANADDVRTLTRTWQFARLEKPWGTATAKAGE
jgi:CheY-like chemotaxis protein